MNHLTGIDAVLNVAQASTPAPSNIDSTWVLITSFSALLTILGFAFISSGAVRYKSVQSAVITVLLGAVITILFFWLLGYGFAFGDDKGNKFIGLSRFAGAGYGVDASRDDYTNLIFQSVGAIIVSSLFGLGTLERSRFFSVSVCLAVISGFLYPTALHWVQPTGWLSKFGFIDFAGSSYIHFFGGVTALVVSIFLKERRDQAGNVHPGIFPHHSPINIGYGSIILSVATLIFINGANQEGKTDKYEQGLIAVNTLIAATFSALTSFVAQYLKTHKTSLIAIARGSVAGIVAISAIANDVRIWESALTGTLAGLVYIVLILVIKRSHVDDPAYTLATHLGPGLLGTLLVGVLTLSNGFVTGHGFKQFGLQLVGVLALLGWGLLIALFVIPLKGTGVFKINPFQESKGIDTSYAEGEAIQFIDEQPEPSLLSSIPKKGIFQ
ncbi:unnamed protein product (macronuclear) [Paramecium tetraurelia]|uniref:Ammonium transporter AmtB-like domain-containing protein n=1 Tax=Paramecium tetraurelia TaxID=5888 RepID=A0E1C2_PARTE|nr:uncharacterized protein GSPATT00022258001 [Paramecium tetraurelia]CAK89089.1 unnamed protein product [Paramecium tetraurelia]|eukprot:XP_001456486.1 hypothetical protein (macronuclear) [Paramecium tetraurelia strain d4-2]